MQWVATIQAQQGPSMHTCDSRMGWKESNPRMTRAQDTLASSQLVFGLQGLCCIDG